MPTNKHISPDDKLPFLNYGQLEVLQAILSSGCAFRMAALGSSMMPTLYSGDVLTIDPLEGRTPQPGWIVAFIHPGTKRLIIHRILKASGDGWRIRGDNCSVDDGIVTCEGILGVVEQVERNGRDVRCGIRWGGRWIAFLNRNRTFGRLLRLAGLPRRTAERVNRKLFHRKRTR